MRATATHQSLKRTSRWAGVLYALIFLLAPLGFIVGKMPVYAPGDPATTMQQLLDNELLFRLGMLAEVGVVVVEIVLSALLYALFRPVSRSLALGAALTRTAEAVIQALNLAPSMVALAAATGTGVYADMSAQARATVVLGSMDAYQDIVNIWGIPFALHVLFLGLLVLRSNLMPRIIGWLLVAASGGYFADSLAAIVWPAASGVAQTLVLVLAIPAELAFAVWLVVKGVRADRWHTLMRDDAALPAAPGPAVSPQRAAEAKAR
ncbi:DUF4386 domain-containing protein [Demequina sp.]|uniref:DUF4386 domain-containing protein n=1 Tax=Demequina sp. TaxID=2050685 RepID=UPI0025F46ADE|nr:DUF4386 domain-containing protein [Demequina sp.]